MTESLVCVGPSGYTRTHVRQHRELGPGRVPDRGHRAAGQAPLRVLAHWNEGFAGIAAAMDALAVQLDCARVGLVQEAESRGVVSQSPSPSATDWLMAHSPLLAALWARDKGCTYPGCGRPPQWTDAHHLKHWADGGTNQPPEPRAALRLPPLLGPPTRPHRHHHRPRRHLADLSTGHSRQAMPVRVGGKQDWGTGLLVFDRCPATGPVEQDDGHHDRPNEGEEQDGDRERRW